MKFFRAFAKAIVSIVRRYNIISLAVPRPPARTTILAILIGAVGSPLFAQSGAEAPPKVFVTTPQGVNLLDGSFNQEITDISIGSLSLVRSLTTGRVISGEYFGSNWTHNFDIWAQQQSTPLNNYVVVVIGRTTYRYYGTPSSNVPENDEDGNVVTSVSGNIVFTDRDGTIYQFTPTGGIPAQKISSITYANGRVLTFTYSSWRPKVISSNDGYALVFDYSGTSNRITAACGFELSQVYVSSSTTCASGSLKASYSYTASGSSYYLSSATDVFSNITQYTYGSSGIIDCIKPPGYSSCKISLTYYTGRAAPGFPPVKSQTFADGNVWNYDCSCGLNALADPDDPYAIEWTTVTKPDGSTASTWFQFGSLYKYFDENNRTSVFYYNHRRPYTMTMPEGDITSWAYNSNGVAQAIAVTEKPSFGSSYITLVAKTFPTSCTPVTCNKPVTTSDANGNIKNLDYYSWGGLKSEMLPAPISGAARPLKLYDYVQKYAYVKSSGGTLVPAAAPIWLLNSETDCQTAAGSSTATCDAGAQTTVTTYEYGANGTADNLLLRGKVVTSGGVSLRTCYGYDAQSNKIWETSPRAGLASCS